MAPESTAKQPVALPYKTKQAIVYDILKEGMRDGTYPPGSRLIIDELSRRFGISQIPVREALQQLQAERMVIWPPHQGPIVASFDPGALDEIFALLEALECIAARAVVTHVTSEQIAELRGLAKRMETRTSNRDLSGWEAINREFHATICRMANLSRVEAMMNNISVEWERLHYHYYRKAAKPDTEHADRDHAAIIDAIAARDGDRLIALIQQHNRGALAHWRSALQQADTK